MNYFNYKLCIVNNEILFSNIAVNVISQTSYLLRRDLKQS